MKRRVAHSFVWQGVKFLYDSVTGTQTENYYGCIMADEMVRDCEEVKPIHTVFLAGSWQDIAMYHTAMDPIGNRR